jgi:hypothetical protein
MENNVRKLELINIVSMYIELVVLAIAKNITRKMEGENKGAKYITLATQTSYLQAGLGFPVLLKDTLEEGDVMLVDLSEDKETEKLLKTVQGKLLLALNEILNKHIERNKSLTKAIG